MNTRIMLAALAAFIGGSICYSSFNSNANLSSSTSMANVEALAEDVEQYAGQPCYTSGNFDISQPLALVCDMPCELKNWDPGWWTQTSICPGEIY